jgi:hypothetical protein
MPAPLIAAAGIGLVGSAVSARAQSKAASQATAAQTQASEAAIAGQLEATRLSLAAQKEAAELSLAEQRRQFDAAQALLKPYVGAGTTALGQQQALIGASGPQAQAAAIQAIQRGPEFGTLVRQGEEAILQSASATGGLRGGNVQEALAKFRPEILSGLINQQYGRLGGLASMGQNAAVGQATQGMNFAGNVGNIYGTQATNVGNIYGTQAANVGNLQGQIGAAQAGGALAQGQATANLFGGIASGAGYLAGQGAFDGLFGGSSLAPATSIRPMQRPF